MTDDFKSNEGDSMLGLTADIVSAYVSKNPIPTVALTDLIAQTHRSLSGLKGVTIAPTPELLPAVAVKKSITPDYIISLEDGRKFKSMKRYLGLLGMTPAEYRARWGLAKDYPMVAPNYAAQRSELAKKSGLGRKAGTPVAKKAQGKATPKAK